MSAQAPLALYVHWPFCVSKCPYCDFNSHVRENVDQPVWREALLADLRHEARLLEGRQLGSIFFGGGTPSLMPPETVSAVINEAVKIWPVTGDVEITLEANPSSVEAARFADIAKAGVNRVSIGLQALDDLSLRFLGRAHGAEEGLAALEIAQDCFARVNFDLIYALPGQELKQWQGDLERALGLNTDHMSLYQLTIEPGTRFETLVRDGSLNPMPADEAAAFYELTQEIMAKAGMPAYEVSNHARQGQQSRHNLTYWRYQDYAGIGPGAHGRRDGQATTRHRKPENWLNAVGRNGHGMESEIQLSGEEQAREALVMGLRLAEGVDLPAIKARTGLSDLIDLQQLAILEREQLVWSENDRLTVTREGMLLLDAILAALVKI